MSLTSGQVTPINGTSTLLVNVPPGVATVVISNVSGATVYVGAGPNPATTTNGFAIPTGAPPVTFPTYPGSTGSQLQVIAGGAVTGPVSFIISTAQ